MKSGILHLNRKVENERRENIFEIGDRPGMIVEREADCATPVLADCELDERRWSVVSFDKREGGSLTNIEASDLMSELDSLSVPGLCIVTDDAAERLNS